jgi:outer membrane protein assembly factor BamA
LKAALSGLLSAKALPSGVSYIMFAEIGHLPSAYKFKVDNANLKIHDFRFSGANRLAPELLAQAVAQAKERDYLRSDTEKLLNLALLPLYWERGYLKATVGETRLAVENGAVLVTVSMNEGEKYRLAGFSWAGNTLISSGDLSNSITLKTGEIVNAAKLNRDLAQARKLLLKFGREAATITAVPSFAANTVTYPFQVKEGDQYYMGRVEIEGFDAETTRKLIESWKLASASPYDNTYLQQSLVRTLALAHGRQTDWLILEQPDDAEKIVNVRLQHN